MNKNNSQKIKEDLLESATKALFKTLEHVSDDTKEKYNASAKDLEEKQKTESHKEALEKQEIADRESKRELREKYANKMFYYMCIWSFFIVITVIINGFGFFGFQLNKWVLVTLIGSTTISIFAIIRAIIEGIFKSR